MEERNKFQAEGLRWLQEMELVNHPQFINQLKLNILMVSPRIREVEFLIYREQKSILIYVELSWIGKTFFRRSILTDANDIVSQMIPTFRFRITEDPKIMNLAITKVQNAITGGKKHESTTSPISKSADVSSNSKDEQSAVITAEPATPIDTKTDTKE